MCLDLVQIRATFKNGEIYELYFVKNTDQNPEQSTLQEEENRAKDTDK